MSLVIAIAALVVIGTVVATLCYHLGFAKGVSYGAGLAIGEMEKQLGQKES